MTKIETVVCALCDTEWELPDEECPECGATVVWDMEAAFVETHVVEEGEQC